MITIDRNAQFKPCRTTSSRSLWVASAAATGRSRRSFGSSRSRTRLVRGSAMSQPATTCIPGRTPSPWPADCQADNTQPRPHEQVVEYFSHAVCLYQLFSLSLRDVALILAERRRNEPISTPFVEGAVNEIVARRM